MTAGTDGSGQSSLPTPNPTNSFWHREPSKLLLGHRSTSSLPASADIVIIGSGISGASAAYHLHEKMNGDELKLVMLEAREACWGATGRNGGHCQPGLYTSAPDVASFELQNYKALKSFISKHEIPCEWKSVSGVHSYMSRAMFDMAVSDVQALQHVSPELAKQVQVVTKASQNPSLSDLRIPKSQGAVIQANAASLWPYKLVSWALEDLITTKLLNLQTNTPATKLQKMDEGWIIHTPRGMISARRVLLCTNAYTSALLPHFGDLIVPVRGEMSSLLIPTSMQPANTVHQPLEHTYVFRGHGTQSIDQDDYLVQRPFSEASSTKGGGELMFGGGRSFASQAGVGISDDSSIDLPAAAYLRRELNVVLDLHNDDEELDASFEWSGIMGFSRDGNPWVGQVDEHLGGGEGLWVCGGYTGHGMPNAWLCGVAAADLVLGKKKEEINIPAGYFTGEERVLKARSYDEVWRADSKAFIDRM